MIVKATHMEARITTVGEPHGEFNRHLEALFALNLKSVTLEWENGSTTRYEVAR